ncbi:kinase-like domain-containing protein [Armillaria novae-zelandiae]|uniref:Kinase-like domain-containing protein n=1 Tax=Armillaria novae-zelandiae TaxID=153914 RepID=A0AA39NXC9_9AGAR|nr:kinase-like domain-containing protein [Armillaria novae-zelandiae]
MGRQDGSAFALQHQVIQSPPASASVPSLSAPSTSPVPLASGLDYPQYQSSKLFPFTGMKKLEEQRRAKGRISGSSSTTDVTILGSVDEGEEIPTSAQSLNTLPGVEPGADHRIGRQTSDTTMRYQYLDSSATASLSSQQDDSNISSTGSSMSRLPTVRKWPKARKTKFLSSPSPPGDGVSYSTASLSYSNILPISYPQDQAIVDALLDTSREPGPWHVLDATTDELVKKVATVLSKSEIYDQLSDLPVIQAQSTLDFLQDLLDIRGLPTSYKRTFLKTSLKLAHVHDCVPRCLTIGGFKTTVEGREVAIKRGRIFTGENNITKVLRKMTREAIIWGQCDHPNVLPFYGIYRDSAPSSFCLVSPFIPNGPLRQYLSNTDNPDRHRLALDITRGMNYLHKMFIVHGDLKGDNILITYDHRAVIADFGISFAMGINFFGTSSSSRKGGTVKWQPPEVLNGNPNSFSADVYSLACVHFEVFDRSLPWGNLNDGAVVMNVSVRKKHPPRPKHLAKTNLWWELMVRCWAYEPSERPTLQNLMECLHVTGDTLPPPPKWDKPDLARLRGPLVQGKLHIPSDLPSFLNVEGVSYLADPGTKSVNPN